MSIFNIHIFNLPTYFINNCSIKDHSLQSSVIKFLLIKAVLIALFWMFRFEYLPSHGTDVIYKVDRLTHDVYRLEGGDTWIEIPEGKSKPVIKETLGEAKSEILVD